MNINDMTYGELQQIASLFRKADDQSHSIVVGANYLIRTVTMIYTGRVVSVTAADLVLKEAAWIADTGRFADALREGNFSEVEPYHNDCVVSRAAIVDMTQINFDPPKSQK